MRCLLLKSPKALRDDKGQKQAGHAFACGYMRATFFMDFWTHPGIRIEIHAYGELGYSHREPPSQAKGLLMARASSRPAPESRLRTPDFRKGFENPRNLREGSLSGQLQSGCDSRSRLKGATATSCAGVKRLHQRYQRFFPNKAEDNCKNITRRIR